MQNKVIYYPDSRFPYLNTNDYKLVTGDRLEFSIECLGIEEMRKTFQVFLLAMADGKTASVIQVSQL